MSTARLFLPFVGLLLFALPSLAQITPLSSRFDPAVETFAFIIPNQRGLIGAGDIKAEACGECHKSIYAQWKRSTHASALSDIQFQAELSKPDSPRWLCLNCHIPVQNQRDSIVVGLANNDIFRPVMKPNPRFDPAMQQEGVTCATCHIRATGPNGASVILGPTGDTHAPHPVKEARVFLRNMCDRCHDPKGDDLTPNLICWFTTKQELAEGQPDIVARYGKNRDCVDCHMPEKQGHAADDYTLLPEKPVNRHFWVGGGIPKRYGGYDDLVRRGYRSALDIRVTDISADSSGVGAVVHLTNERAGHYLPTGDPERFILVRAELIDSTGEVLKDASLRVGQEWLWNPARKVGDNRLKQGETRPWHIRLGVTDNEDLSALRVSALHIRVTSGNAAYLMAAKGIDESLLPNGADLVQEALDHYPLATWIHNEVIDIQTGRRSAASPAELVDLSTKEKGIPLSERHH